MSEISSEIIKECVEDYFSELRDADYRIRFCENRIETIRNQVEGVRCSLGKVHGTSQKDMADGISEMIEWEHVWQDTVKENFGRVERVRNICCLGSVGLRAVWMRHFEQMEIADIAKTIGYSDAHTYRVLNAGRLEFLPYVPARFKKNIS